MKVTKEMLRQIIKEEMEEAMGAQKRAGDARVDHDTIVDMADDVDGIIQNYTGLVVDRDVIIMGLSKMFFGPR